MEMEMGMRMEKELEAVICEEMQAFITTKLKLLARYGHGDRFEHFYAHLVSRHFGPPPELSENYEVWVGRGDDDDYLAEVRINGFGSISIIDTGHGVFIASQRTASFH